MQIPRDEEELVRLASTVIGQCLASRRDRSSLYEVFRRYYMYGSYGGALPGVYYNKVYQSIDKQKSLLYTGETTSFAVDVDLEDESNADLQVSIAQKEADNLRMKWHRDKFDSIVGRAVTWSLVKGTTILKTLYKNGRFQPFMVEPENFGVINEREPELKRQEAMVMVYFQSRESLRRDLMDIYQKEGEPDMTVVNQKLSDISWTPFRRQDDHSWTALPAPLRSIFMATQITDPTMTGQFDIGKMPLMNVIDKPINLSECAEMYELWVWNDEWRDWQTITMAAPSVLILPRTNVKRSIFTPKHHPFTNFTPNPLPDYFWGYPESMRVLLLQDWMNERLEDIRRVIGKQIDSPKAIWGMTGLTDEQLAVAANDRRGIVNMRDPNGKVQDLATPLPPDIFAEVQKIEQMFEETMGLSEVLEGQGASGVRSEGHAQLLSTLGGSRLKTKALTVEDSIEDIGSKMVACDKEYDKLHYTLNDYTFLIADLTDRHIVRVDSHSSSPINNAENVDLGLTLRQLGTIDDKTLIEWLKVPFRDSIRQYLNKKETAEKIAQISAETRANLQAQGQIQSKVQSVK